MLDDRLEPSAESRGPATGEPSSATGLRRDAWGHGYAAEGALALLAHGFDAVGLAHVLGADDGRQPARPGAVLARIGLVLERTWVGEWNEPLPGWEQGEVAYGHPRAVRVRPDRE